MPQNIPTNSQAVMYTIAGYLIPLLQSQEPCNKETQFPIVWGRRN